VFDRVALEIAAAKAYDRRVIPDPDLQQ